MESRHVGMGAVAENYWHVECHRFFHRDGTKCLSLRSCPRYHSKVKVWEDGFANLMTTAGLNKLLDATLKTGLTSPAWYVGLVDNAAFSAFSAADTAASHAGWAEATGYSEGTRQAFTPGSISAGSVSNTASKAVFSMSGAATIHGGFMADLSTKGGATGVLYGEGAFAADRTVANGDILSVTVTATAS